MAHEQTPVGNKDWKRTTKKEAVIRLLETHPNASATRISELARAKGHSVSESHVYNIRHQMKREREKLQTQSPAPIQTSFRGIVSTIKRLRDQLGKEDLLTIIELVS